MACLGELQGRLDIYLRHRAIEALMKGPLGADEVEFGNGLGRRLNRRSLRAQLIRQSKQDSGNLLLFGFPQRLQFIVGVYGLHRFDEDGGARRRKTVRDTLNSSAMIRAYRYHATI